MSDDLPDKIEDLPDRPRRRLGKVPWAASVSAGLAAAAASVLAASVEWDIPPTAKIGVTAPGRSGEGGA
ncbi:hypothetical protein Nocox_30655 [Nonomuraea coxensis DSM 45129]|uniref:Uncharacterized protein n=1 Tax=Nonomuraea coxensis DSM 45129 TaxID=1122611 RepID=A0ABX8U7K9_9ACTN|nr:hypothetical protein [Nonomuraea coxensis]QYC43714.1 hypothetical protein Nocox_30655 [Nonomuraea coxensis DSM 45129]